MDDNSHGVEQEPEEGGHWGDLAQQLGADVPAEEPAPAAPQPSPTSTEPPTKKKERKAKSSSPPPKSHWKSLAGILGLSSSPDAGEEAEEQDQESDEQLEERSVEVVTTDAADPDSEVAEEPRRRSFWGRRKTTASDTPPDSSSPPETSSPVESSETSEQEQPTDSFGWGIVTTETEVTIQETDAAISNLGEKLGTSFEPDETDLRCAESQSVLDTMFTPSDEDVWKEVDEQDSSSDADEDFVDDLDDEFADEFGSEGEATDPVRFKSQDEPEEDESRPRGRRRRRRSQSERTGRDEAKSGSRPSEDQPAEGRRRRRRRRSERSDASAERSSSVDDSADVIDDPNSGPSDSVLRLEASADLFDAPEEAQRGRADGKSHQRRSSGGGEEGRRKHRVPSWNEAVGVIVQRNLDSRSGDSSSNNGNSRRRRGGRRRKPDRRPRSND